MPKFSNRSLLVLEGCDVRLQQICHKVINIYDFTVLEGHRDQLTQEKYFKQGVTKLPWPKSKHNQCPSLAVDIAPYPIDWENHQAFYFLAGLMFAAANNMDIPLRWGGDWNRNFQFKDQSFTDLPHFELV